MSDDDDIDSSEENSREQTAGEDDDVTIDSDRFCRSTESLRRAIRTGHYRVDPDRLAETMLHHPDRPLKPSGRNED